MGAGGQIQWGSKSLNSMPSSMWWSLVEDQFYPLINSRSAVCPQSFKSTWWPFSAQVSFHHVVRSSQALKAPPLTIHNLGLRQVAQGCSMTQIWIVTLTVTIYLFCAYAHVSATFTRCLSLVTGPKDTPLDSCTWGFLCVWLTPSHWTHCIIL